MKALLYFGDSWLEGFRWWRRWRGGHWERWWVEPCRASIWMQVDECFHVSGKRPCVVCRGGPTCEDWRGQK